MNGTTKQPGSTRAAHPLFASTSRRKTPLAETQVIVDPDAHLSNPTSDDSGSTVRELVTSIKCLAIENASVLHKVQQQVSLQLQELWNSLPTNNATASNSVVIVRLKLTKL